MLLNPTNNKRLVAPAPAVFEPGTCSMRSGCSIHQATFHVYLLRLASLTKTITVNLHATQDTEIGIRTLFYQNILKLIVKNTLSVTNTQYFYKSYRNICKGPLYVHVWLLVPLPYLFLYSSYTKKKTCFQFALNSPSEKTNIFFNLLTHSGLQAFGVEQTLYLFPF